MLLLIALLVVVSLISLREFSIRSARANTHSAAEIIRVTLTEAMLNGVIGQRDSFLRRIAAVEGMGTVRLVRSDHVNQQYGPGQAEESAPDAIEDEVLRSGQPYYGLVGDDHSPGFRATIPYTASRHGDVNCLECHQVAEGSVLGAVTLTTSITHMKTDALFTVGVIVLFLSLFALGSTLYFRSMLSPLIKTAEEVQYAVERATQGDFNVQVKRRSDDEIGQIADDFNRLTASLRDKLGAIRDHVALLLHNGSGDSNLITSTSSMVEGLIRVSRFKQAIEEDESRFQAYQRLADTLRRDFLIEHFSIYEVDSERDRMTTVACNDASPTLGCQWCDTEILHRPSHCRAARTGHLIDASDNIGLCQAFAHEATDIGLTHICLPVIQSGSVGNVVQLVVTPEHATELLAGHLHLIQAHLREMGPVMEARRLMDTLRESALRDSLTGLHNRRFLEEYMETVALGNNRRRNHMTLMMLDLDYFKKVNDIHGHDAGDTILKELAQILISKVRAADLVIRYGGEEFLIALLDTDADTATVVAEKIRIAVEQYQFNVGSTVLQKTLSIGYADYPSDGDTLWQVLKFADVALYRAKEEGRNRAIRFEPEMWAQPQEY